MSLLQAIDLKKTFPGPKPLNIIENLSLDIEKGASLAITGPSGEGKSTLLHMLGTLEPLSGGKLFYKKKQIKGSHHNHLRNREFGFIFQAFYLLEDYSVLENILFPLRIAGEATGPGSKGWKFAHELLERVGLAGLGDRSPKVLSGGEKQRVALARALGHKPSLIFADEPTGNLDHATSEEIQGLLLEFVREAEASLILVTHDLNFANKLDQTYLLSSGKLIQE